MSLGADVSRSAYDLAFQVTPIILNQGIASQSLGGMLPIIGLTGQLAAFAQGVLTNGLSLNDFYARFVPIPGSTVLSNAVGTYPFANQRVAGNAYIEQPLMQGRQCQDQAVTDKLAHQDLAVAEGIGQQHTQVIP